MRKWIISKFIWTIIWFGWSGMELCSILIWSSPEFMCVSVLYVDHGNENQFAADITTNKRNWNTQRRTEIDNNNNKIYAIRSTKWRIQKLSLVAVTVGGFLWSEQSLSLVSMRHLRNACVECEFDGIWTEWWWRWIWCAKSMFKWPANEWSEAHSVFIHFVFYMKFQK